MAEKSKILVIGGTGHIGKFIVEASVKLGHPTFALVRESTVSNNPEKSKIINSFNGHGVTLLYGDVHDHKGLVKAIKQVDVVISTVGAELMAEQHKIVSAIKEAGNVKRFLPSEFGGDVDLSQVVEPATDYIELKRKIRRAVEAEGIPYTFIVSNGFAQYFLASLGQLNAKVPPRDKVVILGDGNTRVILLAEEDIATYTIKAVDDQRTLNKILYMRPPANVLSFNDMVALWEKKIGKTLDKINIPEDQLLKNIQEAPSPLNFILAINHNAFVQGNFDIEVPSGVEACQLYPEVKYTTVDKYLDQFV
ncbi:hypothetical protein P3X46_032949 [Hevea brasiliensis]|uniref:NmrA-like domain-containing protein n=1 Tax=Hevea brasiliensis TaxID=3981 RepID=A0ABQ9KHZ8_HEVBR|nr:isoflavone reductase-like protein isoform X2 [Hevea brasiliensis]KAJ9135814.1 hypothetical protein P3X46_032949 [Hevea brasiliensis]